MFLMSVNAKCGCMFGECLRRQPINSTLGRLIQTMLLKGLHVDEDGRPVFDGAFIHVAGGGKGGFDYRFAMPTRHFSVLEAASGHAAGLWFLSGGVPEALVARVVGKQVVGKLGGQDDERDRIGKAVTL